MAAIDHAWQLLKQVVEEDDSEGPYTALLNQFMEEFDAMNAGKKQKVQENRLCQKGQSLLTKKRVKKLIVSPIGAIKA